MNELIPLQPQTINGNAVETVNARELHAFLQSRQDFSTWIKNRIADYDFVENQDFVRFHKKMEANPSRFNLDEAGVHKMYISYPSGSKQVTFINEPNLYRVILLKIKTFWSLLKKK